MRKPSPFLLLLLVGAVLQAGCIFSPKKEPGPEPPAPLPPNDTPENTVLRFILSYEQKKIVEYEGLFTGDFTFEFSNIADPELAQQYSTGWFREDERISARTLFNGGTNRDGEFQPPASSIDLELANPFPNDDNTAGRDPNQFKVLLTPVTLTIDVPPRPGETEGTTYEVGGGLDPQNHRFFLVRGDAANGLDANQDADDKHWYIWRWLDESTSTSVTTGDLAPASHEPAREALTWGRLKAGYR